MTYNGCVCPTCIHETCPPPSREPPYDELTQEVDDNILSVKIPKQKAHFDSEEPLQPENLSFDFNCADEEGEKCKPGCTKVYVIPDQQPPKNKSDEETLSLRAIRHIMPNEDVRSTLEIEFKSPRNYILLPQPGPPPPIIVPKVNIKLRKRRRRRRKK